VTAVGTASEPKFRERFKRDVFHHLPPQITADHNDDNEILLGEKDDNQHEHKQAVSLSFIFPSHFLVLPTV